MLRINVRTQEDIKIGDMIYIWRDNIGWIGPARVEERDATTVTVNHNDRLKTSSINY